MIFVLFPALVLAKGKLTFYCDSIGGPKEYRDSVLSIRLLPMGYDKVYVSIINSSGSRVEMEWENARIDGSHIASPDDYVFELNRARQDEVILPGSISSKLICKRYSTLVPIIDKKKVKKEGLDSFTLMLPYRKDGKEIDLRIKVYAREE